MKVPEPRKLKSGTWFIQMRLGGESVPVSAATRTECIRQAEKIKADYRNGKRLPCKSAQTLEQCLTAYIDAKRGVLSPSTIREYKSMSRNRFTAQMKKPVREIANWQAIVSAEAKSVKPKTLKNAWMMVAAALKFGGYDVPKVTLPQVPPNERQWLDPEQIRIFVADVANEPFAIPALLALHGLRRSEIMAVNWSDIDLTAKTIRVSGAVVIGEDQRPQQKASNKNRSSTRTIPIMIPELLTALEAVEDKSGPVVRCNPNTIYHQINRVCARNGLPQVGTHGLRHSFASLGYHLGVPELEMMQLGGWADNQTMIRIYTHIANADRVKAENAMAGFSHKMLTKMLTQSRKCSVFNGFTVLFSGFDSRIPLQSPLQLPICSGIFCHSPEKPDANLRQAFSFILRPPAVHGVHPAWKTPDRLAPYRRREWPAPEAHTKTAPVSTSRAGSEY